MMRFIEYAGLFIGTVLLQEFVFNNIQFSVYINPYIYIAFILLLPMEIPGWQLLLLSFLLGATIDFLSGTPAIHTIASVAAGFCRPFLLTLFAGKEMIHDGGAPSSVRLGDRKFVFYSLSLIVIHGVILFTMEALDIKLYLYTLTRVMVSSAITFVIVYAGQLPLFRVKKL